MNTKTRIVAGPATQAVLEGALAGARVTDFSEDALKKCVTKGWIQFQGDDGEILGLTASGKDICTRLGLK